MQYRGQKVKQYINRSGNDKDPSFAYEKYINTPSIMDLLIGSYRNILDLGCGDGRFTKELLDKGNNIVGLDLSKELLDNVKKTLPSVVLVKHDLENKFPEFSKDFDLITAKLLLMYINNLDNFAKECNIVLKMGGSLIISITHPLRWHTYFLENKHDYIPNTFFDPLFTGYFQTSRAVKKIGKNNDLEFNFIHRSLETYINTFAKEGFQLELIDEPEISDSFLIKYPSFKKKKDIPLRLNLKFKKVHETTS